MDNTRVSEAAPNAPAGLVRMIDDMDRRYFVLALELGAEEGWDFRLGDIKRVEAMWGCSTATLRLRVRGRAA